MANRFNGSYRHHAKPAKGKPRGIARMVRAAKRHEAEERDLTTVPFQKRSYARERGYPRLQMLWNAEWAKERAK